MTDKVSVAVGIRYIDARNTIDGKLTMSGGVAGEATTHVPLRVDVDQDANGWGGILGVQVAPTDKLNLTMRYETTVKLDFEDDVNTDDIGLYLDGEKKPEGLPGHDRPGCLLPARPQAQMRGRLQLVLPEERGLGRERRRQRQFEPMRGTSGASGPPLHTRRRPNWRSAQGSCTPSMTGQTLTPTTTTTWGPSRSSTPPT